MSVAKIVLVIGFSVISTEVVAEVDMGMSSVCKVDKDDQAFYTPAMEAVVITILILCAWLGSVLQKHVEAARINNEVISSSLQTTCAKHSHVQDMETDDDASTDVDSSDQSSSDEDEVCLRMTHGHKSKKVSQDEAICVIHREVMLDLRPASGALPTDHLLARTLHIDQTTASNITGSSCDACWLSPRCDKWMSPRTIAGLPPTQNFGPPPGLCLAKHDLTPMFDVAEANARLDIQAKACSLEPVVSHDLRDYIGHQCEESDTWREQHIPEVKASKKGSLTGSVVSSIGIGLRPGGALSSMRR